LTTKAEYCSPADRAKEAIYLKRLVQELNLLLQKQAPLLCLDKQVIEDLHQASKLSSVDITINCDNISAIKLARNPVCHARSKHIKLHHHFLQDKILAKKLSVSFWLDQRNKQLIYLQRHWHHFRLQNIEMRLE
jgi:hypothetical protein